MLSCSLAAYSQVAAYLIVISASSPDKDAVPDVEGVHHKEVDDGLQQLLQGVAEAEAEGQYQCGAGQPCPVQVHLHPTHHHRQTLFVRERGGGWGIEMCWEGGERVCGRDVFGVGRVWVEMS